MIEITGDIPRIYTALAEWLACVIYIIMLPKRWRKWTTVGFCGLALVVQGAFLVLTENVAIILWIPVMMAAVGLMFGFIFLGTESTPVLAGYCCAKAFLVAEFVASLEWQIESFLWKVLGVEAILPQKPLMAGLKSGAGALRVAVTVGQILLLAVIYGLVYYIIYLFEKKMRSASFEKQLTVKELVSASAIAVSAFLFSNMSYVITNSPFSSAVLADTFHMRTIGDLCGLVILYAYQTRICEYMVEKELSAMQSVYKKQYDQYRYYQESMEMIHIKYHDLKHQITGLRGVTDEAERKAWLDQLEHELDENRLMERTGNNVLDTILAAKVFQARKNNIRITCVADGKLLNFMHVTDICTIFGNALDNAIESVVTLEDQDKRMIHVTLSKQKNFVLINVSNYIAENIVLEKGALPATSKRDRENHGYGLKSIRQTAEKYKGSMSLQAKDHWFEVRILIPEQ